MITEGVTLCPRCAVDLTPEFRNVLRKVENTQIVRFDCPHCEKAIKITVRVVHHIVIEKDRG